MSQNYEAMLAALHDRCHPRVSGKADVIDLVGESSDSDEAMEEVRSESTTG